MASITDMWDEGDRIAVLARDLDRTLAVMNDTGHRDFTDAIKQATEIRDATEKFLEAIQAYQARKPDDAWPAMQPPRLVPGVSVDGPG
jgi:hypothetical protein